MNKITCLFLIIGLCSACSGGSALPEISEDTLDLKKLARNSNSTNTIVELIRGYTHTDKHGHMFGKNQSKDTVAFSLNGCSDQTTIQVSGYDIDTATEVEVLVNHTKIGYLSSGSRNNAFNSGDQFKIDALTNESTIVSFNQTRGSKERWGVTNILAYECNATPVQISNTPDNNQYGHLLNESTNYAEAVFAFEKQNAALTLSVTGYDINNNNEVSVWLNEEQIGTLSKGRKQTWNSGDKFILTTEDQLSGQNLITFKQSNPGAYWGVTSLSIIPTVITFPDTEDPAPDTTTLDIRIAEFVVVPSEESGRTARLIALTNDGVNLFAVSSIEGKIYKVSEGSATLWFNVKQALSGKLNDTNSIEGGLRSLAFHPEFASNGKFYTSEVHNRPQNNADLKYLSDAAVPSTFDSVVSEWTHEANGSFSGPREVLRIGTPGPHIIKQISFNPYATFEDDDYGLLYIAHGDGGVFYDPLGGQNNDALGKILRINPLQEESQAYSVPSDNPFLSNSNMLDEVYAIGLRSPHNLAFTKSGQLIAADIGNLNVEEVNFVDAGGDYGWKMREGTNVHLGAELGTGVAPLPENDATFGYTYPVAQFNHDPQYSGGVAIAGAYPIENDSELHGVYIYGEFATLGDLYYSDLSAMQQAVTKGHPSALRTAPTLNFNVLFDHDANPETPSVEKSSMLDIINDSTFYPQNGNRADLRFGRGPMGEVYITSKQNNTIYIVENSVPKSQARNDSYTVMKNASLQVQASGVLENDSNGLATTVVNTGTQHGSVTLNTDGSFKYVPDKGFVGQDSFTYKSTANGLDYSNEATVTITVTKK